MQSVIANVLVSDAQQSLQILNLLSFAMIGLCLIISIIIKIITINTVLHCCIHDDVLIVG